MCISRRFNAEYFVSEQNVVTNISIYCSKNDVCLSKHSFIVTQFRLYMSRCVLAIATSASDTGFYKKIYLYMYYVSVSYGIKPVKPFGKTHASLIIFNISIDFSGSNGNINRAFLPLVNSKNISQPIKMLSAIRKHFLIQACSISSIGGALYPHYGKHLRSSRCLHFSSPPYFT